MENAVARDMVCTILKNMERRRGEKVKNWWLYQLTVTDRTNIVCFIILMVISVICIVIVKKMKLPIWKFQIGWILFMDALGTLLLVSRLING